MLSAERRSVVGEFDPGRGGCQAAAGLLERVATRHILHIVPYWQHARQKLASAHGVDDGGSRGAAAGALQLPHGAGVGGQRPRRLERESKQPRCDATRAGWARGFRTANPGAGALALNGREGCTNPASGRSLPGRRSGCARRATSPKALSHGRLCEPVAPAAPAVGCAEARIARDPAFASARRTVRGWRRFRARSADLRTRTPMTLVETDNGLAALQRNAARVGARVPDGAPGRRGAASRRAGGLHKPCFGTLFGSRKPCDRLTVRCAAVPCCVAARPCPGRVATRLKRRLRGRGGVGGVLPRGPRISRDGRR
ncbi:hypothetical protein HNQ78_000860 [Phycisphaera mikurensis]|nr:hypothetical protein [Phycisphaera mikurensis]